MPMPNTINMTLDEAESERTVRHKHDDNRGVSRQNSQGGVVISQSPTKVHGVEARRSRAILTVSKGMDMVMVPVLTGGSRAEAVRELDR